MNLLGKILTFAILFTAIIVMVVAVAVYGTHKNWQEEYDALQSRMVALQTEKNDLETKYGEQISQLQAEQTAALQDVSKLETERATLVSENAQLAQERDRLLGEQRAIAELVAATEENNRRLAEEVATMRNMIVEAQTARDKAFTTTLAATTDLHTKAGQLASLQERHQQITQQLAQTSAALREGGIDVSGEVVPRVRGKVSDVARADGTQLIEITIGADDGIKRGHTVEVFRGNRYLGRAEILRTDPDRAVARIIREFQQGPIQKDDDVATKLRS